MEDEVERQLRREIAQLKELINTKVEAQNCLNRERWVNMDKALALQAKEYERRLDNLNHEAERIKSFQSLSVSRELYDAQHKEVCNKLEYLQNIINKGQGHSSGISGTLVSIGVVITLLIALSGLILSVIR